MCFFAYLIIYYETLDVRPLDILPSIKDRLKLEKITDRKFTKLEIEKDCKLREAIEYHSKLFKQGHTYYEFTHKKENVSVDKELIFFNEVRESRLMLYMHHQSLRLEHKPMQDTCEYFTSKLPHDKLSLYGEGVRKPDYGKYKVFVQSTGSGARHLPAGSFLLYEQVAM